MVELEIIESQAEIDAFKEWAATQHATSLIKSGEFTIFKDAVEYARSRVGEYFNSKLAPQQKIYQISLMRTGQRVGVIWLSMQPPSARVCSIFIEETFRRKGFAKEAMRLVEDYCALAGVDFISLNVFDYNTPAMKLYRNLGYENKSGSTCGRKPKSIKCEMTKNLVSKVVR